jgi:rubrerythrin
MAEPSYPPVAQPKMATAAIVDNRTELPDQVVLDVIRDRWVEVAGLQFGQPTSFQLYSTQQGSMLARTPFRTPTNVIDEIRLARSVADTDDDIGAAIGQMIAIAFGDGLVNQHRDEKTLEFFNQMTAPTAMDLETVMEELYREYLIAGSVNTVTIFSRNRLQYFPMKSDTPVQAQLQVPNVGVLPAENIRVISNDLLRGGELAYNVEDMNLKAWLDEYLDPRTSGGRKAIMAMQEPISAALFTGKREIPYTDGDPASRGLTLYTLNPRMVHRSTMPKGANPYPRPLLTRNFALLEAKRLLNIMDYALLQGGTNYIVVAKKGTDHLPAQQPEVDNLMEQVRHASRSGVMVGDHRLTIEIITPDLKELLNPTKRKLLGRKLKMGLMRQTEEVPNDTGTQGATNEMELTARVISADRRKLVRHAQATFYDETATRNRSVFPMGAPQIWAPKLILSNVSQFWQNVLQARDRGDIPRRYVVEALGYDFDAAVAERERELANGIDEILMPGAVPFSNPGQPQDNSPGRPPGSSSNNGRSQDAPGPASVRQRRVIMRNAGETVTAMVENDEVHYVGETTAAMLEHYGESADFNGYVTQAERDAIDHHITLRSGPSVIVPVNPSARCDEFACVKLDDGLRMIVGRRIGDGAMLARALRFSEPQWDLKHASEYALRWGFITEPLTEEARRRRRDSSSTLGGYGLTCYNCGSTLNPQNNGPVCPHCGADNGPGSPSSAPFSTGGGESTALLEVVTRQQEMVDRLIEELAKGGIEPGKYAYLKCPNCGLVQDAAHDKCSRCGHDLTEARRGMFAYYEKKGVKPTLHSKPPPPASKQKDYRDDKAAWEEGETLLDEWAKTEHERLEGGQ